MLSLPREVCSLTLFLSVGCWLAVVVVVVVVVIVVVFVVDVVVVVVIVVVVVTIVLVVGCCLLDDDKVVVAKAHVQWEDSVRSMGDPTAYRVGLDRL